MSALNIVNVATITGKTAAVVTTASAVAAVTNTAASGLVYKINTILATNTSALAGDISVDFYRGVVGSLIAPAITVPPKATLSLIGKDTPFYLEEADAIRVFSDVPGNFSVIISYEILG